MNAKERTARAYAIEAAERLARKQEAVAYVFQRPPTTWFRVGVRADLDGTDRVHQIVTPEQARGEIPARKLYDRPSTVAELGDWDRDKLNAQAAISAGVAQPEEPEEEACPDVPTVEDAPEPDQQDAALPDLTVNQARALGKCRMLFEDNTATYFRDDQVGESAGTLAAVASAGYMREASDVTPDGAKLYRLAIPGPDAWMPHAAAKAAYAPNLVRTFDPEVDRPEPLPIPIPPGGRIKPPATDYLVWDTESREFVAEVDLATGEIDYTGERRHARHFRGATWKEYFEGSRFVFEPANAAPPAGLAPGPADSIPDHKPTRRMPAVEQAEPPPAPEAKAPPKLSNMQRAALKRIDAIDEATEEDASLFVTSHQVGARYATMLALRDRGHLAGPHGTTDDVPAHERLFSVMRKSTATNRV